MNLTEKMNLTQKLLYIQQNLKVPKNQRNKFGDFKYRSCYLMLAKREAGNCPRKEGFRKLSEKELKKKYQIFCDVWKLYKDHAKEKVQEWDWEQIVSEIDRITKEYDCEFCYALCHAVLEEFERMETSINKK